ncbi:MAG TPA: cupin [Roseobacter sp.]|uniref:Cupin 2 conserved barrel domain-containing protein n=1 Tax=marine sediment metagenome TaxID=412755 RepID=A0A0F9DUX5_9ZZZZ|nr:cupin [Roseobacter sp.]HEC71846.1 cupin [Roseobacter sp.]|tara:strand:+ start:303 stop:608 length:306 start_codon:yes stop_codon:yes gene_type:complete
MCKATGAGSAVSDVIIENDRARVTRWCFSKRDDNTGWHVHEHDYLVIPLHDGVLDIRDGQGNITRSELRVSVPYFGKRGVEHDVSSPNDFEFAFIEVEFFV